MTAPSLPLPDDTGAGCGILAGIARHGYRKGPVELVTAVDVTVDGGIEGDYRGQRKPGGTGKRQVTLMEQGDWGAVMTELGRSVPWQERRVNLLVDELDLPQTAGVRLRIGEVVLEVTVECEPCHRMEAVAPGLLAALRPDWRGGACSRVLHGGRIAVGDAIRIEQP